SGPTGSENGRCQNRSRSPWSASNTSNGSQRRTVPLVFLTGAIVCSTMRVLLSPRVWGWEVDAHVASVTIGSISVTWSVCCSIALVETVLDELQQPLMF